LFHLNQKFFIAHKFKKNAFIQGIQHSRDGHGSGGAVAVEFLNIRRGPSALVGGFFYKKAMFSIFLKFLIPLISLIQLVFFTS
jgi:hypothetical protein